MNKEKLTPIQFSCLVCFPMLALFSGIGTHNIIRIAEIDSYLSVLMSYGIGLLPLLLFLGIFNYKQELNIVDKNKYLFGKYLGTIINYLINICIFAIGIMLLYNVSNFAISQFLSETPRLVFMILLGIILIYNVSLGIENISKVAIIFLGIICLLTIISTAGVMPTFELSNIKPILEFGIKNPLKGSLALTLTNVVPIFMLLIVPKNQVQQNKKTHKYIFGFYTLAFLFMFLALILTIGSLGIYLCDLYQYPEYTVLKKISIFNFLDRIENFIYIKWILNAIICLALIIYYIQFSIKKTSKKLLPTIIVGLLIFISLYFFKNSTAFYQACLSIFPYICLFLFIIYLVIGLNILIRKILNTE